MTRSRLTYLLLALLLILPLNLTAQKRTEKGKATEQEDSIARLIQADTLQLVEKHGITYRKVKGHARFLHNNTYLICDSALWNVNTKVIDAMGHVQLKQEKTVLSSDKLTYYVDRDLAEFRGDIVKLVDEDNNTLKTKFLDYNTKDSVAVFRNGGAMRDKDGQVIESRTGTYDSKIKTFTFNDDVNMFSDSMFVKTSYLKYESDRNTATFGFGTNAWKDDSMLSANAGWYNRDNELFFFQRQVHVMSDTQEAWSDSLFFNRATNDVQMLGNVQVTDTTRNVYAVAGKIDYVDSLGRTVMTRKPAVMSETEEEDEYGVAQKDSVFFGADTLIYLSVKMCDVDSLEKVKSAARLEIVHADPVAALRQQAAEAARKAAEEAAASDPNNPENAKKAAEAAKAAADEAKQAGMKREKPKARGAQKDATMQDDASVDDGAPQEITDLADEQEETDAPADSLSAQMPVPTPDEGESPDAEPADSVGTDADVVVEPLDTTKVGFVYAYKNVRLYRKSMQMVCDSLSYNDLDSLARLYYSPVIWNEEGKHQYCADSVYAVIVDQKMEKAHLLSEAFIHIQEDSLHFDQIKSAEMTAFFSDENELSRFDALGGASALFYLEENNTLATVNKKDCRMMSARFKDGEIEKIYYFDTAKSDGYPVVQMHDDDKYLKGFSWSPDKRPKDRFAITNLNLRPSQRTKYRNVSEPKFIQTEIYFPGYIGDIHRQIEVRDSLARIREVRAERDRQMREQLAERERRDSLEHVQDSLAIAAEEALAAADSLASEHTPIITVPEPDDNQPETTVKEKEDEFREMTPADIAAAEAAAKASAKADAKAAKEAEKKARQDAQDAKWAEKEAKIKAKEDAKKEKAADKVRKKKAKALRSQARQDAKDQAKLNAYKARYQKKLDKKNKK